MRTNLDFGCIKEESGFTPFIVLTQDETRIVLAADHSFVSEKAAMLFLDHMVEVMTQGARKGSREVDLSGSPHFTKLTAPGSNTEN